MLRIKGLVLLLFSFGVWAQQSNKNVLLILVDDLRPELSFYKETLAITPNIDQLAASGIYYKNAYCNVPVCGASRASMLTGKRPSPKRFLTYNTKIDNDMPYNPTLGQYLRSHGFYTISNNKVAHHKQDASGSWDEEWYPEGKRWRNYLNPINKKKDENKIPGLPYEAEDVKDNAYYDGQTAEKTILDLKRLKENDKPFFIAMGLVKPHLPFNSPKKYWDLYNEKDILLPKQKTFPKSLPSQAYHKWGELRYYESIPKKGQVSDALSKKLIHGYLACVSYIDAQIGHVIATLNELGLDKNTLVILTSDHGWSLMEHGLWAKHSNFKNALQVPFVVSDPMSRQVGVSNSFVELIDVYPTICDWLEVPVLAHLDGISLLPTFEAPQKIFKDYAWARWKKGETLIKQKWSLTKWFQSGKVNKMMFNHAIDPDENLNLSNSTEAQLQLKKLEDELDAFIKHQK